jgi:hypothetical protein
MGGGAGKRVRRERKEGVGQGAGRTCRSVSSLERILICRNVSTLVPCSVSTSTALQHGALIVLQYGYLLLAHP